jgi:hypothetical protein
MKNLRKVSKLETVNPKIPETVRQDLLALQAAAKDAQNAFQTAQRELNMAARIAYRFLGLDPDLPHQVDLTTGIVVPYAAPAAKEDILRAPIAPIDLANGTTPIRAESNHATADPVPV